MFGILAVSSSSPELYLFHPFCYTLESLSERSFFDVVDGRGSIWDKMTAWARHYDGFKDDSSAIAKNKRRDQKLNYEDVVNTDDGLLQLSGHLGKSDVSAANFASPERVVVSSSYDKHNRLLAG